MTMERHGLLVLLLMVGAIKAWGVPVAATGTADLTKAVVVTAGARADAVELQAALMLRQEVLRRTGLNWRQSDSLPNSDVPVVIIGSRDRMPPLPAGVRLPEPVMKDGKPAPEGYTLTVDATARPAPTVVVIGNDRRGALFGVGRLLRALDWDEGKASVPATLKAASAPAYPVRGAQLGYRPGNDTTDAWDVGQFAQYFRDLIIFGNNSVELIPEIFPGDDSPSPRGGVMSSTIWDNTIALCALANAYDLDVWFWLPHGGGRTMSEADKQKNLAARDALFAACQRVDHVFVPGGDPGDTPPQVLMPYLKELAATLRKRHPKAGLWISTQGFEKENLDYFYEYLQKNQPDWLTGVVFGPWAKDTLEHTRQAVPRKYPVRHYPDITHTVRCQYPFPAWDEPWARAHERQPIMPRPTQMAHICRLLSPYTNGSIGYSDSSGDDVNKMLWGALLWDPQADLKELLRDYGRCFVGSAYSEGVAEGLLMLEKNWVGPALTNAQVPKTISHWQGMERSAGPAAMGSWRFQQGLIRAYADAYLQERVKQETALLEQAYEKLRKAPQTGPEPALAAAEDILKMADPATVAPALHKRVEELAGMLHDSIGQQLSMEKYGANSIDRGALLETIVAPLTDASWLLLQIPEIRGLAGPKAQLAAIERIVNWTDAGPGGFYDDLGNQANGKAPHMVPGPGWEKDPGFVVSVQDEHSGTKAPQGTRASWLNQATTLFETPLRMRYQGLDRRATYVFKATYAGRYNSTLQLYFDGKRVGDPIKTVSSDPQVHEFKVPRAATADGVLDVMWEKTAGRGVQVAEAWLIKQK